MSKHYDFSGYATKNDLLCSDGRTIRRDAFKECDGKIVPLVWNHRHDDPEMVIGHALLENRKDGVYGYYTFNDTEKGKACKKILDNGDITGLSIYANNLKQKAGDVLHGVIREVSLVLSGANPGAIIDFPMAHGEDGDAEMYAYLIGYDLTQLQHSNESEDQMYEDEMIHADDGGEEESKKKKGEEPDGGEKGKTIKDIFDAMTDEQKTAVYAIVAAAAGADEGDEDDDEDEDEDDEGDDKPMKHNVFDNEETTNYLSHSDEVAILDDAKNGTGSFQKSFSAFMEANDIDGEFIQHDFQSSGFVQNTQTSGNVSWLFPEYKDVRPGAPELITSDQGWISTVMSKVHKSPISRVRTQHVDIRNIDSLRARGYQKGKEKQLTGNFQLVRRTTDPQTVYVRSNLHRDDIIDITDFDYVQYLYNIDRMNLNEELAMAIMLGDFRPDSSDDKIFPEHIRPIWTDDELYTLHRDVDIAAARTSLQGTETGSYFGDNYVYSEAVIEAALYAREDFKGTGTPDFYLTPHMLNVMLLARDRNGRRIFSGKSELASALNVGAIYTAEQFANRTRKDSDNNTHKLLGLMVNLADYTVGSTKGGEITHFTQFDIDFNGQKSLLETRISGALTRVYSAIALEEPVA